MLRARLAYTIARHSLRSLDSLEKLLLQVTRKNDARGYERFRTCLRPSSPTTSKRKSMSSHTAQTELKFVGKLILEGDLHCGAGLHIGAGKGSLEIGGADNPVEGLTGHPYIPGSSLRGKLRSLLEQASGLAVPSELVYVSRRRGRRSAFIKRPSG